VARTVAPADSGDVPVDHVVAVVGNHPILASQVEEQLFTQISQQGAAAPATPADSAALRKQIVSDIIDDELLVQAAQRDTSIKVTDQEVADGVEQTIRNIRGRFSSEPDFRDELRKAGFGTPEEYRRFLTDQTRREFYRNKLISKLKDEGKLKPVQPTEAEMRAFFDQQKGQLGKRPATISFRQVIVAPVASDSAKARAKALADSIVTELRKGADFATAAKRFSQDPGTKDLGGDLGWGRRGTWVPEFERVAFALRPGAISDPVESPFGFHIIQVQRVQPGEVQARHILIIPEVSPASVDSARRVAERVAEAIKAGAPIDSLQRLYHDGSQEREANDAPVDKLPEPYAKVTAGADSGAVVGPFEIDQPDGSKKFGVLKLTARIPEGDMRYDDVRDRVRDRLGENLSIRRYLDRLRQATYVDVRG
jgi:peptidyl-prolyl cis-trans isomerase SurA